MAVAVLLRTGTWWYPHTLLGVMEYDDGVYYGAAKLLLHGELPYSDYTIVHPPVVSLLMLPPALFGQVFGDPAGMAAARVLMQVVACLNVLLVYRLALRLGPTVPALVAAGLYAVMPDAVIAEHTVLLEPLVNLGCLLAIWLLLKGRPAAAGVLLAAACGIKLFAAVYVIVAVGWLLATNRRHLLRLLAGGAIGTLVLIVPFALADPDAFWHDIVVTQLSRPQDATDYGFDRIVSMTGLGYAPVGLGLVLLAVVLAVTVRTRSELTLWLAVALLGGVAFVTSSSYFPHYGAFLAPPLALLVSRLWLVRWQQAVLAAVTVVFLIGSGVDVIDQQGQADLREAGALVPTGSCVYTDAVSLTLAADLFADPTSGCPGWIDGRGVALTWNNDWPGTRSFYPAGFVADERWQAANVAQMGRAQFLLLRSPPASFPEWSAATRRYVTGHFAPVWVQHRGRQHSELWRRVTSG